MEERTADVSMFHFPSRFYSEYDPPRPPFSFFSRDRIVKAKRKGKWWRARNEVAKKIRPKFDRRERERESESFDLRPPLGEQRRMTGDLESGHAKQFYINGYVSAGTEREGGGGNSAKGIGKDVLTRLDKDLRRECGSAMECSKRFQAWSQFQLPSSIKATRAPNILRASLHYPPPPRSSPRPNFLSTFFLPFFFSILFSLRVIEV